jgi:prepilin-type N-terminal cleavage/methylation domain-containing protein
MQILNLRRAGVKPSLSYPSKRMGVKNLRNKQQKGFTLIELLVVIAIIGLLASVVLLALNSARAKSRDAKRISDVRQIMSGLELYFNECGSYPIGTNINTTTTTNAKLYTGTAATCGTNDGTATNGGIGTTSSGTVLIAQMPSSPTPADSTTCQTGTANAYSYSSTGVAGGKAAGYSLTFCLGAATGGLSGGARTASEGGIQ